MNNRLEQFLSAENISQSQFADVLGVARASISHIIAGRNKPGYEFICNIMRCYPALNIEWLLLGKGKMYKTSKEELQDNTAQPLVNNEIPYEEEPEPKLFQEDKEEPEVKPKAKESTQINVPEHAVTPSASAASTERRILKVIALYDDLTWKEIS